MENLKFQIIGPSCVGKTTLLGMLEKELNIPTIKSWTTRPKRNEQEDSYHFITEDEFLKTKNEFVDVSLHLGNFYGLKYSDFENDSKPIAFTTNIAGYINLQGKLSNVLTVILIPANINELLERIKENRPNDYEQRQKLACIEISILKTLNVDNVFYIRSLDDFQNVLEELKKYL